MNGKKIYNNFGGICGSYKIFSQLMDEFTGNFQCLVFKKGGQSNRLEDCVFWAKAHGWRWNKDKGKKLHPYPEGWKFGCNEFKQWNKDRYNKNYVEPIV